MGGGQESLICLGGWVCYLKLSPKKHFFYTLPYHLLLYVIKAVLLLILSLGGVRDVGGRGGGGLQVDRDAG